MITIAIFAVIAAIAIPNFQRLIESNHVTSQTNNLLTAMKIARSEAVKLGAPVTLTAVGGDFTDGWCIYEGAAGSNCGNNALQFVRQFDGMDGVVVDPDATTIEFDAQGRMSSPANAVNIGIEPLNCEAASERRREININLAGRASSTREECN